MVSSRSKPPGTPCVGPEEAQEPNWGTLAMCCSAAAAGKAHRPHVAIFDLASFGDASVQGEGAGRAHP